MRGFLLLLQLTGINRPGGEEITYEYDSRGNRTQASAREIDTSNFVPSEYEYNEWDELSGIRINGSTYSFEYDPEELRTVKETPEESIRYHCDDNGLVIAESDATDTVTAQNIWGHKPLARKINGSYYYYVYNGHGDVIQVLDESGNIVNSYQYDEWGNILNQQETVDNPLKYCGEYYDDESGLYYLRARYYDPKVGRFVSQDEEEGDITNPLTLNRYAYCAGNPLIYVDPSGRVCREQLCEVIGSTPVPDYTDTSQATTDTHGGSHLANTPWTGGTSSSSGSSTGNSQSTWGTDGNPVGYSSNGVASSVYNSNPYKWYDNQSPGVQMVVSIPTAFAVSGTTLAAIAVAVYGATWGLSIEAYMTVEAFIYKTATKISTAGSVGQKVADKIPAAFEAAKKTINTPYDPTQAPKNTKDLIKKTATELKKSYGNNIKPVVNKGVNTLKTTFNNAKNKVGNFFKGLFK